MESIDATLRAAERAAFASGHAAETGTAVASTSDVPALGEGATIGRRPTISPSIQNPADEASQSAAAQAPSADARARANLYQRRYLERKRSAAEFSKNELAAKDQTIAEQNRKITEQDTKIASLEAQIEVLARHPMAGPSTSDHQVLFNLRTERDEFRQRNQILSEDSSRKEKLLAQSLQSSSALYAEVAQQNAALLQLRQEQSTLTAELGKIDTQIKQLGESNRKLQERGAEKEMALLGVQQENSSLYSSIAQKNIQLLDANQQIDRLKREKSALESSMQAQAGAQAAGEAPAAAAQSVVDGGALDVDRLAANPDAFADWLNPDDLVDFPAQSSQGKRARVESPVPEESPIQPVSSVELSESN